MENERALCPARIRLLDGIGSSQHFTFAICVRRPLPRVKLTGYLGCGGIASMESRRRANHCSASRAVLGVDFCHLLCIQRSIHFDRNTAHLGCRAARRAMGYDRVEPGGSGCSYRSCAQQNADDAAINLERDYAPRPCVRLRV